ncbi:hypothetical protein ACUN9Z_31025, partial [Escherichia sp. HC-CC4]
ATLLWVKLCRRNDDKSRGKRNNSNTPYEYNKGGFTTDIIALAYYCAMIEEHDAELEENHAWAL